MLCEKIEKNYFLFKQDSALINQLYHENLYMKEQLQMFVKGEESFSGVIKFVNESGQLVVDVDGQQEFYNMGDIKFMI